MNSAAIFFTTCTKNVTMDLDVEIDGVQNLIENYRNIVEITLDMWVSTWSTPLRWKTTILPVKDLNILLYVIQIITSHNWRPLLGMLEKIFAYVRRAIEIICRIYWIQRGGGHSERRHKFLDHKIPTKYHTWSSKPFTDNFNYSGMKVSMQILLGINQKSYCYRWGD